MLEHQLSFFKARKLNSSRDSPERTLLRQKLNCMDKESLHKQQSHL